MSTEIFIALQTRPYRVPLSRKIRQGPAEAYQSLQGLFTWELMSWIQDLPVVGSRALIRPLDYKGRLAISAESSFYFRHIYNLVLRRATSHEADRLIILSTMLNLRPLDVLEIPPDKRLSAVITSVTRLPAQLLFMNHEPESARGQPKSWIPTQKLYRPIEAVSQHTMFRDDEERDSLHRQHDGSWRFQVESNEMQCLFVLTPEQLSTTNLLVTVGQLTYSIILMHSGNDQKTGQAISLRHLCGTTNSRSYVLFLKNRVAIQETSSSNAVPGALFEFYVLDHAPGLYLTLRRFSAP